jgi:hypothetical protein
MTRWVENNEQGNFVFDLVDDESLPPVGFVSSININRWNAYQWSHEGFYYIGQYERLAEAQRAVLEATGLTVDRTSQTPSPWPTEASEAFPTGPEHYTQSHPTDIALDPEWDSELRSSLERLRLTRQQYMEEN